MQTLLKKRKIRKNTHICSFVQTKYWEDKPEIKNNELPMRTSERLVRSGNAVAGAGENDVSLSTQRSMTFFFFA